MTAPKHSPDYARLTSNLNRAKVKQEDNALYQTTANIITGVKKLNDFIDASFLSVFGNLQQASEILAIFAEQLIDLQLRNQPGSVVDGTFLLPDSVLTLLSDFTTLASAYYNVNAQLAFDTNTTGTRFLGIYVDGTLKRRVQIDGQAEGQTSISVSALVFCGVGSLVEAYGYQDSGGDLTVDFSVDLIRLSYV